MITIYHNLHCSKSREALSIAQQFATDKNRIIKIIEYLKTPLTLEQLVILQQKLRVPVEEMIRNNEEEYTKLALYKASPSELLKAISMHPILLQRPILISGEHAIIGRPVERILNFLENS